MNESNKQNGQNEWRRFFNKVLIERKRIRFKFEPISYQRAVNQVKREMQLTCYNRIQFNDNEQEKWNETEL